MNILLLANDLFRINQAAIFIQCNSLHYCIMMIILAANEHILSKPKHTTLRNFTDFSKITEAIT